jgi:ribosomal protein S18 acetylase RimI-like enzyme
MSMQYDVRLLGSADFESIMGLEESLFGAKGEKTLGPFYVRLCCDFYNDTSFIARADGVPAGYLLSFVKGREAYCTTLGIVPGFQRTRLVHHLIRAFIRAIAYRVDSLWFTVHEDNREARALHATLGALETEVRPDYYGPGDSRIVSRLERSAFERLRARFERLGLLDPRALSEDVA